MDELRGDFEQRFAKKVSKHDAMICWERSAFATGSVLETVPHISAQNREQQQQHKRMHMEVASGSMSSGRGSSSGRKPAAYNTTRHSIRQSCADSTTSTGTAIMGTGVSSHTESTNSRGFPTIRQSCAPLITAPGTVVSAVGALSYTRNTRPGRRSPKPGPVDRFDPTVGPK